MEKNQLIAIVVIVTIVTGAGVGLMLTQQEFVEKTYSTLTIYSNLDNSSIAIGYPEEGFWGVETGNINWFDTLPYTKNSYRV